MSQSGDTPLIVAASKGDKAVAEYFITHKAKLDAANKHGDTALHRAAYQSHTTVVELLLNEGTPLNVQNEASVMCVLMCIIN